MVLVTTYLITLWLAAAAALTARCAPAPRLTVMMPRAARRVFLLAAATPLP
jgi:hypothetical protein